MTPQTRPDNATAFTIATQGYAGGIPLLAHDLGNLLTFSGVEKTWIIHPARQASAAQRT